jgi:hypothetical protein
VSRFLCLCEGGYEISRRKITFASRNFADEYREIRVKIAQNFAKHCHYGGVDLGHAPNKKKFREIKKKRLSYPPSSVHMKEQCRSVEQQFSSDELYIKKISDCAMNCAVCLLKSIKKLRGILSAGMIFQLGRSGIFYLRPMEKAKRLCSFSYALLKAPLGIHIQNVQSRNDRSKNCPSHNVPSRNDPVTKGPRSRNGPSPKVPLQNVPHHEMTQVTKRSKF